MNYLGLLSLPAGTLQDLGSRCVQHPSPAGTPLERRGALLLALLAVLIASAAALLN